MSTSESASGKASRGENRTHRSKPAKQGETREEAKMIGQWRIGRTIGKGSSGRVKIAKHAVTGKYAAIKIVPKGLILNSRMSVSEAGARADKILLGIEREIVIMKLIDHPNVLNLYDVWETSGELFLIMEYVPGGELFDYLVKRGRLPESEALHYFQQIVHAVDYCHRFNICHRDLKPENLLLDKDKNIKVADFGMAAWQAGERMLETSCGSPHYASPEIVAGKAYHGSASDIWSCGIILFALITGRLPFDDDNIRVLLLKVKTGIFEMPKEVQGPARDLLYRMLEKDPKRRITMPEILLHPFFISLPSNNVPGRPLVPPPSLDEVERPVDSAAELDPDIMGNLKTLWHGAADEDIVAALLCKEKTWEKAIYHLLIKYRNKHLENYNAEEEQPRAQTRRSIKVSDTNAREPLKENSHAKSVINQNIATNEEQSRPQAPTPTKAQGTQREENMGPTVQERLAKLNLRPTPQGPRPPMSPRTSDRHTGLQSLRPAPIVVDKDQTPRKSSSELPGSRRESIQAPTVEDTEVQRFFQEVAEQLNSLGAGSSIASGSSSQASPTIDQAVQLGDTSQFADAEEDESDIFMPYTPVTENDAFSIHSFGLGNPMHSQAAADRAPPELIRRASVRSNGGASRPRSGFWNDPPAPGQSESARIPAQIELAAPQTSLPRDASYVYVELSDHLETYDWADSRSARGSTSINSRWSEATKSGRKALSVRAVPFGARQAHPETSDNPKRSWFQNLFHFKPNAYTLWSHESVSITARVLQQQLSLLNVRVATETLADQMVLRCKFSRPEGTAAERSGSRSIYFKIEVMHAMSTSSFKTGASFSLVKGAHSVFKELCDSVRRNYRLDRQESTK